MAEILKAFQNVCCFSGPRPFKMPFGGDESTREIIGLKTQLRSEIESAISRDYRHFLVGMAMGFDIYSGEALLSLREKYTHIKITAVCACQNQPQRFPDDWKRRYYALLKSADESLFLFDRYNPQCYYARDRYMIDNSSYLICYYTGHGGGTGYTVSYARERRINIKNIADDNLNLFFD